MAVPQVRGPPWTNVPNVSVEPGRSVPRLSEEPRVADTRCVEPQTSIDPCCGDRERLAGSAGGEKSGLRLVLARGISRTTGTAGGAQLAVSGEVTSADLA